MAKYESQDIRNITFIGGGDSGKTSLIEALLFKAGAASRLFLVARFKNGAPGRLRLVLGSPGRHGHDPK